MAEHDVVVAVATYRSKWEAKRDLDVVAGADHGTVPVAGILVEKGADGRLTVGAQRGIIPDVTWHGLLPGAVLTAITAPLGICVLAPVVPAPAAWAGVAALVAHFWHDIAKHQLRTMSDLLEACQAAILVVALDRTEQDVAGRLGDTTTTVSTVRTSADFEADFAAAVGGRITQSK